MSAGVERGESRGWGNRALELVALVAILAMAAFLRFHQLSTNPGWYSDEGTLADIAKHLSQGRVQYQALTESTLLVARLPLVPLLVAALLPAEGDALQTLRLLTASLGVISTGAVYLVLRISPDRARVGLALLAAGLFAIYPPAVFYSRVGFSYNLLTPLVLLTFAGLWLYLERGLPAGAVVAGLAVGLGSVTDLMMVSVLIAAALVVLQRNWKALLWWMPLSLAPLALYALSIVARDPAVFAADLRFIVERLTAVPWWAQLSLIALNFGTLLLNEAWWIPALIGLALLSPSRLRLLALFLLLMPLVLLGRSTGLAGLRLYSISPLFPFIAIGVASLLWTGVPWMVALIRGAVADQARRIAWCTDARLGQWAAVRLEVLGSAAAVFLLVLAPITISSLNLTTAVQDGFRPNHAWAFIPVGPARQAIELVARQTGPGDLVLASPAVAWALNSQTADFQQLLAYSGEATIDYPGSLPQSRFAYPLSLERASFAVVDSVWRAWGAQHMLEVDQLLDRIERWPLVWESGGIEVRQNPER